MRVDDNTNEFVVRDGLRFVDASALAAELEARGHKQTYWVSRVDAPAADAADGLR